MSCVVVVLLQIKVELEKNPSLGLGIREGGTEQDTNVKPVSSPSLLSLSPSSHSELLCNTCFLHSVWFFKHLSGICMLLCMKMTFAACGSV